jgi:hypothetical protein
LLDARHPATVARPPDQAPAGAMTAAIANLSCGALVD